MPKELCKDCVNFLSHNTNTCLCDFEYWDEMEYKDAILNVPEMFECTHFEPISKIIKSDWMNDRKDCSSKFNRKC